MTPIVYRSSDASAPALDGQVGSLIAVLDACLVNGYGAQSAAGWAKVYAGTNKAVYRAPVFSASPTEAKRFYLRVQDDGSVDARTAVLHGYQTMSDVDTGTGRFPLADSFGHCLGDITYIYKSSTADATAKSWTLVADDRGFWLNTNVTSTSFAASLNDGVMYFGDIQPWMNYDWGGAAVLIASANSDGTNVTCGMNMANVIGDTSFTLADYGCSVAYLNSVESCRFPEDIAIFGGDMFSTSTSLGDVLGMRYPDPVSGKLVFCRPFVASDLLSRVYPVGYLPGLYVPMSYIYGSMNPSDTFIVSAPGTVVDGHTFLVFSAPQTSRAGNILINVTDFWGEP